MRIRNIIGIGLAAMAISAGAAAPAQAAPPPDHVIVLESAGPVEADAWADCKWYLCLWDNEEYQGRLVPNWQSGNLGSYQDNADSVRNTTGYWIMLYLDANYRGVPCLLVPPLGHHNNLSQIHPRWHDSISSVQYFQYEADAIRSCRA